MTVLLTSEVTLFLSLPVLVDEALIFAVRINCSYSSRHLPVDPHNFMVEESGDIEVLLQDLLSGSEVRRCKTELNKIMMIFSVISRNMFVSLIQMVNGLYLYLYCICITQH